jgi:DNA-binding transcriptional MerR regulator
VTRSSALTIGQVSELLGVPVPTLRSWHRRYGVALPDRTPGGHRRYGAADLAALQALSTAVSRGIAPRTAALTLRDAPVDPRLPLEFLAELLDLAAAYDQPGVLRLIERAHGELGLEGVVDRLLLPSLREIGRRWELGQLDEGVEHLTTTAARRWVARQVAGAAEPRSAAPVLLAGAPGNDHVVALEAFEAVLRCRGWATRQLGANTPVPALLAAQRATGAQAAVVTAHQVSRRRAAVEALQALTTALPSSRFFAGAAFDAARQRSGVPGTYLGTVLTDGADLLEQQLSG